MLIHGKLHCLFSNIICTGMLMNVCVIIFSTDETIHETLRMADLQKTVLLVIARKCVIIPECPFQQIYNPPGYMHVVATSKLGIHVSHIVCLIPPCQKRKETGIRYGATHTGTFCPTYLQIQLYPVKVWVIIKCMYVLVICSHQRNTVGLHITLQKSMHTASAQTYGSVVKHYCPFFPVRNTFFPVENTCSSIFVQIFLPEACFFCNCQFLHYYKTLRCEQTGVCCKRCLFLFVKPETQTLSF